MSLRVLATCSRATWVLYMEVDNIRIKHKAVLSFLMKLVTESSLANALGILSLYDSIFYIISERSVPLMPYTADALLTND